MRRVRFAIPPDCDQIAAIHVRSWQKAYRDIVPADFLANLSLERRLDWWRSHLDDQQTIVVEVDGEVAGFVRVGATEDPQWGEVRSIYLDPQHYRQGLGSVLLDAGQTRLREMGFDQAFLWVFVDNHPSRSFYEARGWSAEPRVALMELGGRQLTEIRYSKALV